MCNILHQKVSNMACGKKQIVFATATQISVTTCCVGVQIAMGLKNNYVGVAVPAFVWSFVSFLTGVASCKLPKRSRISFVCVLASILCVCMSLIFNILALMHILTGNQTAKAAMPAHILLELMCTCIIVFVYWSSMITERLEVSNQSISSYQTEGSTYSDASKIPGTDYSSRPDLHVIGDSSVEYFPFLGSNTSINRYV